jgi:UPF0716 protein FxsA
VLFLSFLLFFAAEVVVFVLVAQQIGFLWALVLLILVSALGPFIMKRVGFSILSHTRARLEDGQLPTRELLDGLVVFIAGVLICIPGFIGDAIGLALMIGPLRHLVIKLSGHRIAKKVQTSPVLRWHVIDVRSRPTSTGPYRPYETEEPEPPRELPGETS